MASRLWASQVAALLKISCSRSPPSIGFRLPFSRGFAAVIENFKYSDSHEWVKVDGSVATVGITDHAQDHLGDVVFVDLPDTGTVVSKGGNFGAVESVKATSDIISPVSGEVVELNSKLNSSPGLINASPYDEGWIIKVHMNNPSEVDSLMDAEHYRDFCEKENSGH